MAFKFFSHNGQLLPAEKALVPLSNLEYSYGYGVYETIRVKGSLAFFVDQHCQRPLSSAAVIDLEHPFSADEVKQYIMDLIKANQVVSANIKILLIGSVKKDKADLYLLCLNPQFIDRKSYRDGVSCITYKYQREYAQAKTLNMLPSYLAYRAARLAEAYDALLIDQKGYIREGSRTNILCLINKLIYSPPSEQILPGVMRANVLTVAKNNGYDYAEKPLNLAEIIQCDSCFLTSASTKILPIKQIDNQPLNASSAELRQLIKLFDQYLDNYAAQFSQML